MSTPGHGAAGRSSHLGRVSANLGRLGRRAGSPLPRSTPPTSGAAPSVIYLVSAAGYPNYGDELITACWLRELAVRAPDAEVWVDCQSPGTAAVLCDGLHPRARFVDTLWRLCWEAPSAEPWELAAWVRHAVANPGLAPRWAAGIELLRRVCVIHLVGGGFLQSAWPRHIGLVAGCTATARHGARAVLTGQGLIPTDASALPLLAALLDAFEIADLRDEPSGELLNAAGAGRVTVSTDDAFLATQQSHLPGAVRDQPSATDAPDFMLCAQSDMLQVSRAELAGMLLRTLRDWDVDPGNLGILECIPRVDRELYAMLEHELPGCRFYPFAELWSAGLPARPGQTWLSTRFHPHLMAAAAGASGVAIPVGSDYYRTKHASLLAQGSRWTLAGDLTGAPPALPTEGGFATSTVQTQQAQKAKLADAIYGPQ
jgi:polysaccharide pyruvyl transferase WcaK-like protein